MDSGLSQDVLDRYVNRISDACYGNGQCQETRKCLEQIVRDIVNDAKAGTEGPERKPLVAACGLEVGKRYMCIRSNGTRVALWCHGCPPGESGTVLTEHPYLSNSDWWYGTGEFSEFSEEQE